ncbi:MAG TPA: porin family protein [Sphingobacterium sp.]|nr:porin family protein [Sphingobacterium sp.]
MLNFTKKLFAPIALMATTLLGTTAHAQDYYSNSRNGVEEKNFRLGLSINPNIGWLRYDNDYDASTKVGFSYGLLADLGFAKNYYFSTGLLINAINSKVDPAFLPAESNDPAIPKYKDVSLKYAEVPLTVKLKSEENDLGRFYGQFGFTAGLKVSGKEKLEGGNKSSIDGDDLFRLGLKLGGGAEWRLSDNLSLLTGLSFNNGFTRAIKEGKPKTSYVALNIGVFF